MDQQQAKRCQATYGHLKRQCLLDEGHDGEHEALGMGRWRTKWIDPPYSPMSPDELAELSREAGRPLTESEALEYLKRKIHRQAVNNMLNSVDTK